MNDHKELLNTLKVHLRSMKKNGAISEVVRIEEIKTVADAVEQLIAQRDILEAVNRGLTEADDEIIKGLQIDLVKTAKLRDYLGRKYGDCVSCCAFNCDKRDKSNNSPCGNWESAE